MGRPVAVGHDVARPCAHAATGPTSLDRPFLRSPHLAGGDYLTLTNMATREGHAGRQRAVSSQPSASQSRAEPGYLIVGLGISRLVYHL